MIKSKQKHISYNMVAFFLEKKANSLRKSDSCDIYYSLPLKYSVYSQVLKDTWLATCDIIEKA